MGLTSTVILLQAVLAGVFLQGGSRDPYNGWINAHGVGADVATLLALASAVVAFRGLGAGRDLVIGSVTLFVLLLVESLLGHLINGSIGGFNHDKLTIIHIPLAMALIAMTAWLATRAAQLART